MKFLLAATFTASVTASAALAATTTAQFGVRLTVEAACRLASTSDLNFGTNGVLQTNIDQTNTISVHCTAGTPFNIGLNAGVGTGATVGTRYMTGPGDATIGYRLFQEAARNTIWGNTVGTDTVAGTGTGSNEDFTVYGRVPPQSSPAVGVYTDTVTITVTY